MAAKKKAKRRGGVHPGVVLIPPKGRNGWQMRFKDPDSQRFKWEAVPAALTTAEGRENHCKRKSRDLAKRKLALAEGAARATGSTLSKSIDRYFDAHPHLRPRTVEGYRGAANKLLKWAEQVKLESADDLNRAKLMEFREVLIASPKMLTRTGGKRGERVESDAKRSAERVNSEFRKLRTILGYLADADMLPRMTRGQEDLRRAFKRLPTTSERMHFLKPAEIVQLLQSALLHDSETFVETRDEHAGEGRTRIGTTPRYDAIAPIVAFCLLTGCRFGEALALEWRDVDLDALDSAGTPVGEIHLRGESVKTRRGRTIGLEVSPALRGMLQVLRERAGGERATGLVFGLSRGIANAAARRLIKEYGAPPSFGWQALRRTAGTYLSNAGGIFGASSAYRSAKQLGHSVTVAERSYVGLVRGIPATAKTLEDAMGVREALTASIPQPAAPAPTEE